MLDIRDFYITWEGHPRYKSDEIIVEDILRVIINKMEMILFSNKGDFIGDLDFGADLNFFLWQTNVSTDYIKSIIQQQFDKYIPELQNYSYTINLEMMEGTFADILIVNITLNNLNIQAVFS
jgi:hypothetical protein